ncbi:hypothetical protein DSO57_1026928 [Entomophthora muscae]|uniref:Uncharacterized protein n=1 Tax=Entomophthora muscae TaxID=34485 RepID=A0ACC2RSW4_9FUNG|nr:hypothetical protein DSO57_1026928 [Entomophthora muscae]
MVNDVTTKMMSLVYSPVYGCNGVPVALLEKVKPVLETMYEPYMSDSNEGENDKLPQYYHTIKGQKELKRVAAFYSQVLMLCFVPNPNESLPASKKAKYHVIPNSTCKTFIRLMECCNLSYGVVVTVFT